MLLVNERNCFMSLSNLVVSAKSVAEDDLASSLEGVFSIVQESGEALPLPAVKKLDIPTQIIAYLLALRAGVILKFRDSAAARPEEISATLGLDVQRTREALSRLKRSFLSRAEAGYEIPLVRTMSAIEELQRKRSGL